MDIIMVLIIIDLGIGNTYTLANLDLDFFNR